MKINRRILFYALGVLVIVLIFSVAIASGASGPGTDPFRPPETETAAPPVLATEPAPNPVEGQGEQLIDPPLLAPETPGNDLPGDVIQPTEQTDPPQSEGGLPQPQTPTATINAVVVRSWGGCSSTDLIWDDLNTTWANYGSTQIHINYNYPGLCNGPITYADLAASNADVVIISDPSGGAGQYSAAEISAIQQYALEGHHLVGTYLLFQNGPIDNRGLAPLFGLQAGLTYGFADVTPTYTFLEATNPLFKRLPSPYASSGYATSQVPASGTWTGAALNGARIAGINADQKAAILSYHGPNYHATYITSMPEYRGGTADKQLIYNAITYDVIDAVVVRSYHACTSTGLIWDSLNATWPSYGAVPIHIRYAAPGLCSGTITYAGLVASRADVVILDNPIGGDQQYSSAEINALQQYAQEGHNLIGALGLLQYTPIDNRGLAPLFGLQAGLTYTGQFVTSTFTFLEASNPLFKHVAAPYTSAWNGSQVPASGTWTGAALNGARYVGINADRTAAITVYDAPNYRAIYITTSSNMGGGVADEQFFYNAVRYAIDAVVVRSWGGCSSAGLVWDSLNATSTDYGSFPVYINYNYRGLCDGTITHAALVDSRADVVILSNPAGGNQLYSAAEINAIQQYAMEGHHLVGTLALLQRSAPDIDNRGLAPLFGLQGGLTYGGDFVTPTYTFLEAANPLFKHLPSPYASSGYNGSQVPASGTWSGAALNGARIVGINANQKAAILSYHGPNYHATYITSMPEYGGGTDDIQLIYNAITYDVIDAVLVRSFGGCSSTSLIWDSLNATWPSYGAVPIHLRYAAPGLCSGTITYAGLVASQADVVIFSDPEGQQYSAPEISVLQQYAQEGHNLIGTAALLQFGSTDNRGLAPLFGLQAGLTYTAATGVIPTYSLLEASNPLFRYLAAPYTSVFQGSQWPASGTWTGAALNGARFVGINADQRAAILVYDAPKYHAIYITSMPEWNGGAADKQFFYNAIIYRYQINLPFLRK